MIDVRRPSDQLRFASVVCLAFALLYLSTRSSILIGDAAAFIAVAQEGSPALFHYGEPTHFLQGPLARMVWLALHSLGAGVSLGAVFVAMSLAGTVAAVVFVGLIAWELLGTQTAAWLGAILFGTSLHSVTQWNGELYGLALGFVCAAIFLALRGRVFGPAILWALAVLSHSDFALAAPVMVLAVWTGCPNGVPRARVLRATTVLVVAGTCAVVMLLLGAWAIGKWTDGASLVAWLTRSVGGREQDVAATPEIGRAIKGLITAYTVAGHYWRDILTGRGQFDVPGFLPAAAAGLIVILCTGLCVVAAAWQRRVFGFALLWLLPFHTLVNWWFVPTVEKYHAGALPGLVLLVTAGLVSIGARMHTRARQVLFGTYVAACAALNVGGAALPMQSVGERTAEATRDIRALYTASGERAVFVACADPKAIVAAGVPLHKLRSVWLGTVPEIQAALVSWITARIDGGQTVYLVGRWCFPEDWKTSSSKAPFDLYFLEAFFQMVPSPVVDIPVGESVPTNPFTWAQGDILHVTFKEAGRD